MNVAQAVAIDVICILLFAIIGRSSHSEGTHVLEILTTGWPFLVGCGLGLLLARGWRHPASLSTGVAVWVVTVVAGISLRLLSGATAQLAFVIVATIALGLLLVGWRAGFAVIRRARRVRTS